MVRRPVRRGLVGLAVVLLGVAVAVPLLVYRAVVDDARRTAARLLGCPTVQVEAQSWGDTEHWRVEGCGVRGTMICEPSDPGCAIVEE